MAASADVSNIFVICIKQGLTHRRRWKGGSRYRKAAGAKNEKEYVLLLGFIKGEFAGGRNLTDFL
ncbi:hypothetical protein [Geobacillus subterraneus]|uniref:hypothetical protein n=1 Tax=Geobacillus subterraneus TaxID=129338 RepID=UPI00160F3D72